jgi:hypothetical protein
MLENTPTTGHMVSTDATVLKKNKEKYCVE